MACSDNFDHIVLQQFALSVNVQLHVMATGYDMENAPSGIVCQYYIEIILTKVNRKKVLL